MASKQKKITKLFQLIVQVGNFPHIKHYHVSDPRYYSREAAIAAGEKHLKEHGFEASRKYIHTKYIYRGPKKQSKNPLNIRELTKRAKLIPRWITDKQIRDELGIKAAY